MASAARTFCIALIIGALAFLLGDAWRDGKLKPLLNSISTDADAEREAQVEKWVQDHPEQVRQIAESSRTKARVAANQKSQSLRVPEAERLSLKRAQMSLSANDSAQSASQDDAPPAPPRRLAPEGTFFLLEYVSARTDHGIIGFEPGQRVKLVEPLPAKGMLLVSDGQYKAEIPPSQLTNDLDLANLAKMRDSASQRQIQAYQEEQRRQYETLSAKVNEEYSKRVSETNAKVVASSVVGAARSPLNESPKPASVLYHGYIWNGSPYNYLYPRYYSSSYGYPYYYNTSNGYNY